MIKLLVMCGTGIATSTLAKEKIERWLVEKSYASQVEVYQGKISDEFNKLGNYEIVLSTTNVPQEISDEVIMATSLITGRGMDKTFLQIEKQIIRLLNNN